MGVMYAELEKECSNIIIKLPSSIIDGKDKDYASDVYLTFLLKLANPNLKF